MKRSNNKQKEMTAALYVRLSRDDNLEGDSSIVTPEIPSSQNINKFV